MTSGEHGNGPTRRQLMRLSKLAEWKLNAQSTINTPYGKVDMSDPKQLRAHAQRVILSVSTQESRGGGARLDAARELLELADAIEQKQRMEAYQAQQEAKQRAEAQPRSAVEKPTPIVEYRKRVSARRE